MQYFKKFGAGVAVLLLITIAPAFAENSIGVETLAADEVLTHVQQEEDFTNANEKQNTINMVGMLIEVGSTDVPTTMIIRGNADHVDYTVNIGANTALGQRRDQYTNLADWIPGDQIRVIGLRNENTNVIDAHIVANLSIKTVTDFGLNGWIDGIDETTGIIQVQWQGKMIPVHITESTHIVAGLKNPATLADLQIGDRVRGRLLKRVGEDVREAKILIVLRRGENLFMKVRTWVTRGQLVALDNITTPTRMQVKILVNKNLRAGDVNNLVGQVGDVRTVNVSTDTKLVTYNAGKMTLEDMVIGDRLLIVGRANDAGEIDARIIKDNTARAVSTQGYAGTIVRIDPTTQSASIFWHGAVHRVDLNDARILSSVDGDKSVLAVGDLRVGDRVRGRGTKNARLPIINCDLLVVVKNQNYTYGDTIKLERKIVETPEGTVEVEVEVEATGTSSTTVSIETSMEGKTVLSDDGSVTTGDAAVSTDVTTSVGGGSDTSVTTNSTSSASTGGNSG